MAILCILDKLISSLHKIKTTVNLKIRPLTTKFLIISICIIFMIKVEMIGRGSGRKFVLIIIIIIYQLLFN